MNDQAFGARLARALKHRNYRLFFLGQGVSLTGTWLTRVATSWLVYRLSHSAVMLGLVSFASLIPASILTPFAGVLVDRWNRHRVLTLAQIAAALQATALAILTIGGWITIPHLLILSGIQGLIRAFEIPARQAFVVEMIEDRADLPNAIALNSSLANLARLLGPSFAGILIASVGEGGCFAIDAISYLAVISTLLMMRLRPVPPKSTAPKKMRQELLEGFAYARSSPVILAVLGLLALISFTGVPYRTLLPMIVSERLGGDARILGYLTAASGLGALGGALFLASRPSLKGIGRVISLSALTFGLGLMLFGLSHSFWFSLPMMLVTGLGMMVEMAASNTLIQSLVSEDMRGRVMSLYAMAFTGMMPFGGLFGGFLAAQIGAGPTLAWGGSLCCLGGLAFGAVLPRLRRHQEQDPNRLQGF